MEAQGVTPNRYHFLNYFATILKVGFKGITSALDEIGGNVKTLTEEKKRHSLQALASAPPLNISPKAQEKIDLTQKLMLNVYHHRNISLDEDAKGPFPINLHVETQLALDDLDPRSEVSIGINLDKDRMLINLPEHYPLLITEATSENKQDNPKLTALLDHIKKAILQKRLSSEQKEVVETFFNKNHQAL
jgi:hypothetical protein